MSNKNRLTPSSYELDLEYLDDSLILFANTVEEAMLRLGAKPGQDYTYRDLMSWAIELQGTVGVEDLKCDWDKTHTDAK